MSAIVKEQSTEKSLDALGRNRPGAPRQVIHDTTPELELILTVIGSSWPEEGVDRARELISSGLDWRAFLRIAIYHGVIDLVFDNLRGVAVELLPQSLADSLQANSQSSAHRNLYFSSELIHIIGLLEAGGIRVVSLKGPLLGSYLYDNISLRPFGDLDLVVHKEDILRAKSILVHEGFRPASIMSASEELKYIDSQFALTLTRRRGDFQTIAELHWALTHRFFSFRFKPEDMWKSLTKYDFSGTSITTLSKPLLLLFLCVHGAKHHWSRLIWLCDVVRLADKFEDADWVELKMLAIKTRSVRMVCVALYLGELLLGYKATPEMSKVMNADKVAKNWALKLSAFYKSGSVEKPPKLLTMRFQTGVRENINDRWGSYLQQFRLVVSPTDTDRQVVGLPILLSPLYYLIRPLRVIYQKTRK